jgi:putative sigma-54 modulation protein
MYAAIDSLIDKLDRTIIKHKEKALSHRHDATSLKHVADE